MMPLSRLLAEWIAQSSATTNLRDGIESPNDETAARIALVAIADPDRVRVDLGPLAHGIPTTSLAGIEIVHALACAGVPMTDLPGRPWLPSDSSPPVRAALATLVEHGPQAARQTLGDVGSKQLDVDDLASIVSVLIDAFDALRAGRETWRHFDAWHAIVDRNADGHPEVGVLLWIARVVHHDLGGNSLGSVAQWVEATIRSQASRADQSTRDIRLEGRTRLSDDPERIRAHPENRLLAWERTARPVKELVDLPLDRLGVELARSVLVDPRQSPRDADAIVERLAAQTPVSPEARLSIADALCALACIGVELPEVVRSRMRVWGPSLTAVEPPLPGRVRGGLSALAHDDIVRAGYVAAEPHRDETGARVFPNDILAVLGHLIMAVRQRSPMEVSVGEMWHRIGEELDELCASQVVDEPTVLWLARVVFHTLDRRPLGEVAAHAHDWLWSISDELAEIRRTLATRTASFPIGRALCGGAYRIDQWLAGTGGQRLYRGVELATGGRVVVAYDTFTRQDPVELTRAVSYRAPGVYELAEIGRIDGERDYWVLVERVPAGDWLPRALGAADPWAAPRKAIELGVSAGRILMRAGDAGQVMTDIRPELMWMATVDGRHEVTGLSTRATEMFDRYRGDAATRPIFVRDYRSPEAFARIATDDRSVSFSLAVMIAQWATGRFPLRDPSSNFSDRQTRDSRIFLDLPRAMRDLLEAAMSTRVQARPHLTDFVDALSTLA